MMKKLLAIFLCLFLTVSLLAVAVSASGIEEETAVCEATLKGYQNQNNGYGVRVIAEVTNIDAYSEVGFVLSNGTKEITRAATCVFQTLIAADDKGNQYEALTAGEGSYLYALTIMGINAEDALTLTVTPYTTSKEGVTVRGTEKTLTKIAGETFAVRHTVTYVCDSETVGTVSVVHGERAALPTPPTGYYWSMANVGDVCNITDDKTVTLTKVESSLYEAVDTSKLTITKGALTDEVKAKYSVVISHSGSATKDPSLQSYALVLYQAGQTVEWKTDAAGKLRFVGNCDKKGQHITLGLYIDGYLWGEYQLDTPMALSWIVENVPAGMHTFRIEVLAATVDAGGDAFAGWSGLAFSQILYQELIPTTATVTFKNGSEVFDTVTVNVGETVSALATNPTKQYYLFKEWQKDGAAYDFSTAVTENITLTAAFERDPAYVTVTFNNEGVTNTVFIEKNTTATAPTAPTKDGYTFGGWLLNGEVFNFETAVAEDITLTAKWTADSAEYTITFVDTEGTTIKTVKVLEGKDIDVAELPKAGTKQYYAASTEDWKKCFGVTQNQTITLTLCTEADDYSNWKETWITYADGVTQCQTAFNLQFSEDWWIDNGNAGKAQAAGRYLTISGDISYLRFGYHLSAANGDTPGQSAVVKVYVDDCLVDTITFDNSAGTAAMSGKQVVTPFLAGQHTIKIEIAEGSCAITCLGVRQRPAAATTSAAQVQAILVDTKENGI